MYDRTAAKINSKVFKKFDIVTWRPLSGRKFKCVGGRARDVAAHTLFSNDGTCCSRDTSQLHRRSEDALNSETSLGRRVYRDSPNGKSQKYFLTFLTYIRVVGEFAEVNEISVLHEMFAERLFSSLAIYW